MPDISLPDDEFCKTLPSMFDARAHEIWKQAQIFAAEYSDRSVTPKDYFAAWLYFTPDAPLVSLDRFLMVSNDKRKVPIYCPWDKPTELEPTYPLTQVFTSALGNSWRFMSKQETVDHRWTIPGLLSSKYMIKDLLLKIDVNPIKYLWHLLDYFGEPFNNLFGHYRFDNISPYLFNDKPVGMPESRSNFFCSPI